MPQIENFLARDLKPWLENNLELPAYTAKSLSRATGLSVGEVLNLVNSGMINVTDSNGNIWQAQLLTELPPVVQKNVIKGTRRNRRNQLVPFSVSKNEPIPRTLLDIRELNQAGINLNPKRLIKQSRYQSHAPGGGPVVKAGFQQKRLSNQIITAARREMKIVFTPFSPVNKPEAIEVKIKEFVKPEIDQFVDWLKEVGFGNNWVLGDKESRLINDLTAFSQGEPVDFLIWNCIGFDWLPNQNGEYPPCRLNNNLDAAITLYYQEKLLELTNYLSQIGSPNLFVLVPSNEALYEEMWTYTQPPDERQALLNRTVAGLNQEMVNLPWPNNTYVEALRWDEYLNRNNILTDPKQYSFAGRDKIIASPQFPVIQQSAITDGANYFRQYGLTVNKNVLAEKRITYEGMYAGEGIALKEIMNRSSKRIVMINLEEFRVAKRTFFGADGNLSIITPVKPKEMEEYYRWENQIQQVRLQQYVQN